MHWRGRVAVITGGSRGIGLEVARQAIARGARVGLIARTAPELRRAAEQVGAAWMAADVGDPGQAADALAALARELGHPDIVVNNAGAGAYGAFLDSPPDLAERLMRANYLGAVHVTRTVLPEMVRRRRGHVVFVGSVAGRVGAPFEAAYSASKFALTGLAEALTVELDPLGVGVSLINPGPVATTFFATRGHGYDRRRPRPIPAQRAAAAVVAAVERGREQVTVPASLGAAVAAKVLAPALYRRGIRRSFARELAALGMRTRRR